MNNFVKVVCSICTMVVFLVSTSAMAENKEVSIESPIKVIDANSLVGIWDYTAENTLPEYSKGVIIISLVNKIYSVKIKLENVAVTGQNIKVDENKITFDIYVEGNSIPVKLVAVGKKLTGESYSPEGVVTIKGVKQKKM